MVSFSFIKVTDMHFVNDEVRGNDIGSCTYLSSDLHHFHSINTLPQFTKDFGDKTVSGLMSVWQKRCRGCCQSASHFSACYIEITFIPHPTVICNEYKVGLRTTNQVCNSFAGRRSLFYKRYGYLSSRNNQIWNGTQCPDLTQKDFFLWCYVKSMVYETPVEPQEKFIG